MLSKYASLEDILNYASQEEFNARMREFLEVQTANVLKSSIENVMIVSDGNGDMEEELRNLEYDNDALQDEVDDLNRTVADLEDEVEDLQARIKDLEGEEDDD